MICSACNTVNQTGARFCTGCGSTLAVVCAACNQPCPPTARFCPQCGQALAATPAGAASRFVASEGELKQITVLFADVSGSTSLIEGLDPEDADKRLAPALDAMKDAVRRFGGSVVRTEGDGIMAVFGTPNPQEDHAVRACCAGLDLQACVKELPGETLPVRVGIHSGEVLARMVATDLSTDFDATGIAVHIAKRLETLAPVGRIAISPATLRASRQFVSVESMGQCDIRGLSQPLEVFLLTGLRSGRTSLRFTGERERSDFVGREHDVALLERSFKRASEGDGCAVGLVAEAGVGKSRLCFEFAERCRTAGVRVLEGRALAHSRATPFEPVIDVLKSLFEIAVDDTPAAARGKIAAMLDRLDVELGSELALLCDFLGVADPAQTREKLDPAARRNRINVLLRRLIRLIGRDNPAVVLFEDLHFMDSGSESLLEALVESLSGTRILLLVNFRPGYAAPWMRGDRYDQIALAPLRQEAADLLARRMLGEDESVASLLPLIADRARGNPFFIEELVRKFHESGHLEGQFGAFRLVRAPDMKLIPDTVQAIVAARVDSRPDLERGLLQAAAVIGREFVAPLLERVSGVAGEIVQAALGRLSSAGLVYEAGSAAIGGFAFRHPMVQEVVYRSLRSERRRALHASIAADLETSLPDPGGAQAGLIAYHLEEAGNAAQAATYNMKAAMWHGTRDPAQALDAWMRVRRLLLTLPLQGPARYPLIMASGQIVNFGWREGLTQADVEPYYNEALDIARSLNDVRAISLLTLAYARAGASDGSAIEYVASVNDAMAALDPAKHAGLVVILTALRAHAFKHAGHLRNALADNDAALANVDKVEEQDELTLGFKVWVWVKGMRGQIMATMGRFDEAQRIAAELLADETRVDVLHRMLAHGALVDVAMGLGDEALATRHSALNHALAEKSGNPYLLVYGRAYLGVGQAMRGDYSEAATTLNEAIRFARQRHVALENEARMLGDLAWVQAQAGLGTRALATAEEAAAVARRRGAKVWLAYAERLIGGPQSPAFRALVAETGAEWLLRLPAPRA